MMHIGSGIRDEWKFTYTAAQLADGAERQKAHRLSRVAWWTDAKAKVMAEVKESGLEVNESVAAQAGLAYSTTTQAMKPTLSIRGDLQQKLGECHSKINSHTTAAAEYDGWIQVLRANPGDRLELTHADWLYFFGKV